MCACRRGKARTSDATPIDHEECNCIFILTQYNDGQCTAFD